ncbi:MAG: DNA mismatch repair protein MutS, partial [Rhodospirillaceae bacterium]
LGRTPDVARALTRLTLGRGGPRDLAAVRDGLTAAGELRTQVEGLKAVALPDELVQAARDLGDHAALTERLGGALADELPLFARDGGFIRRGCTEALDELVTLRDESRKLVAGLQARYAADTGLAGLKIKHNNVLGYFIELPARQAEQLPKGPESPFIHRQTMANAMRFATVELSDLEGRILKAADRALALELALFAELVDAVAAAAEPIALAARALAELDVMTALAELAERRRYVRPKVDDSHAFAIEGGRHPVVEAALEKGDGGAFVANDCRLDGDDDETGRLWLLTGPNMAGKSTFLRQNALIAVLAQMGSFVPARAARIGVVDRLFSRVGASDDLAQGRSTFMVEMVETATILNQAGPRALVILDEIGRGTATFDGLSIAWAVVEHLHETNRCRALFATHYHELTSLAARLGGLKCHTMRVKEWRDDVVFLHEVAAGAADRSYGIHVGKLAGLPAAVVARAEEILEMLEQGDQGAAVHSLAADLPLFQAMAEAPRAAAKPVDRGPSAAERALDDVAPDEMTPRAALEFLYTLKRLRDEGASG